VCRINGHRDIALVDTGSAYTILKKNYVFLVTEKTQSALTAANGSSISTSGRALVNLTIGKKE
jgi:hypothetical protein